MAQTGQKTLHPIPSSTPSPIRDTGVFAVNVVEYAAREVMNISSGPWDKDVDEFVKAGIEKAPCERIACSRVANAPASLECKLVEIVTLKGEANLMAIGEVVGVHLRDDCVVDGIFDVLKYQPLTRLGYRDYSRITELFSLQRPGD